MDINKIYRKVLLKRAKKIFRGGLLERIFIKAAINKADNQKDSLTLFIGSSYAQYGIISNKYKNAILIASPSQDMYYATRIIHELLQKKNTINKCIMIMGYYAPYHDLSLQQKERINFCGGVYYPLLNDAHHWDTPINNNHWHKEWRYPKKIIEWVNKSIYEYLYETNSYYDDLNSRTILKRNVDIEWAKKTHEEKIILAEKRTGCHNKLLKFLDTYNDNIMIMKEFKQLLDENNINFKFITPPHTELYNDMISNKLKEDIRTFFDKLDMHNAYIDFNSLVQYDDSCFIDPDHLSDIGAERFMKDIDSVLRNMGI